MHENIKGKILVKNGDFYMTSDYYGMDISNEYVSTEYVYKSRYYGFSSTTSSQDVEKVPYYDLDLHQLIYLPNPFKNANKNFSVINNKYCR